MGPPTDASRNSRGREDAIETLIDMDPCGAAYRVARTMVRYSYSVSCYIFLLLLLDGVLNVDC